jgi:WXG100 family type VII secretion target
MSSFSVDPAQLTSTATSIKGQSGEIMDRIRKVMTDVQATENIWTGQARTRYVDMMARWNKTAGDVQAELDRTVQLLSTAATDYGTTETTNTSRFSG